MERNAKKRSYDEPILEIVRLASSDIVTVSNPYDGDDVPDSGWTD